MNHAESTPPFTSPEGRSSSSLKAESSSRRVLRRENILPSEAKIESDVLLPTNSHTRSPSGRLRRENIGETHIEGSPSRRLLRKEESNVLLPSNSHLQLKNYRPSTHNPISTEASESASFFVMVTGNIESAKPSSSGCLNDHLYCRYSFSYGPDWEVVRE